MTRAAESASPYEALVEKEQQPQLSRKLEAGFFHLCLVSGMIVGFFTLFSTLGVNAMIAMVLTNDDNKLPILACNLVWLVINSSFAVAMLGMITKFVPDDSDRSQMEYRFVVGGIMGVGVGWAVVDAVLGISVQDALPFWVALFALFTCLSLANKRLSHVDDDEEEEDTVILV